MFKFDNKHIFTGYLKQKLSSVNIPTCKIYTREFADYLARHGVEDPRVVESINTVAYGADNHQLATRINYLKGNELYNYYNDRGMKTDQKNGWKRANMLFYDSCKSTHGLTKTLNSAGGVYDQNTHEYLGEYLRFLRDYHDVDLMSLYNCFSNTLCNNLNFTFKYHNRAVEFSSYDSKYRIYAFPVKLFADYTIAIDSYHGVEIFCGLYKSHLYNPSSSDRLRKDQVLGAKTYLKTGKISFGQPFLFDKLNVKNWLYTDELKKVSETELRLDTTKITRWDILNREADLKMFIKVPISCRSSIVVLEGDYRHHNHARYLPRHSTNDKVSYDCWKYEQNHSIVNFSCDDKSHKVTNHDSTCNKNFVNDKTGFRPISKLQLLEFNTGESYPFADRLVEYLCGSAITPLDEIHDNIKRAQYVMRQNQHRFRIDGLWENKMQKIIYDYIMNSGPIELDADGKLIDKRLGYQRTLGHTRKSTIYDILGYVDKDAEKWYASTTVDKKAGKSVVRDTIQNVDIYDGLYDI